MESIEYDITLEEGTFFNTLSFFVKDINILSYIHSSLIPLLNQRSISERSIKDIQFSRISNKSGEYFKITVRYCNLPAISLKSLSEEQKIRIALHHMGFAEHDIRNISYRQKGKSGNFAWYITLHDINHNFDPDESFSERNYEINMYKKLREVLGFEIDLNYV